MSLSSASLAITGSGTAKITASVTGSNGFSSPVSLQIAGLPSGVTYSPASLTVAPGTPLQITFAAAATVASAAATLTVTGSSGTLTHSAQLALTVTAGSTIFRTRYTRTDAATAYGLGTQWIVFDPPTNRFFVSDTGGNRVEVLDATKEEMIGSIAVPGAYGIDEAPDHSILYVATQIGDVYTVSPATMQVTKRYMAAQIGSGGYQAYEVRALANGELALLGGQGGIPSVDGYYNIGIWNPTTNALAVYNGFHIGNFTLTGDRSLVVFSSLAAPSGFCTLNPVNVGVACVNPSASVGSVVATPSGETLLWTVLPAGQVAVYDAKTLTQTSAFAINESVSSMTVSADSQTLYVGGGTSLYAYDIATGNQIGWMPNLTVESFSGAANTSPVLQSIDGTGLLAGPMDEGVGFVDTTTLQTGTVGSQFLNDYVTPATGPTSGGTPIQFENLAQSAKLTAAYLGGNAATSISQSDSEFYVTTPAGSAGPADLYALMADGGMLIVPEAFSYGPTILEVTPDAATAEGGGTGTIYGYGFGSATSNATIPTDLQITVGGKAVAITGYAANAYGVGSPPFNLQAATYTIPPGSAGTSADVVVATPSGSATASGALQYMPGVQPAALSGAQLAQGIYDAKRNLYYFTDASQIRVFSRAQGQWLASMQVPAAPAGATHRLWGIALSPDGSKLVVSDASAGMIYLMNPDSPGAVQSFPFNVPYVGGSPDPGAQGVITNPAGVAVSNSGMIYFAAFMYGGDGYDGFFKIDTSSGNVTDYRVDALGGAQYKAAITSDNSTVFFNNDGEMFSIDTATDTVSYASDDPGCCYGDYDLTLSSGQTTLEGTSYLYDTNLNAASYLVLTDRDGLNIAYVYGTKLSPDGTLLFQPSTNGIDVFDGRLGTLRERISLPFALSQNFDALVSDGTDNVLIAITGETGSGIAVVDLSSLAVPAPLPYLRMQTRLRQSQRDHPVTRTGRQMPMTAVKHIAHAPLPQRGERRTSLAPVK